MWGCFLMSGVKILHFLKDWWKSIPIHQNYTMALTIAVWSVIYSQCDWQWLAMWRLKSCWHVVSTLPSVCLQNQCTLHNTLLKSKRHSLRCHDFLVHAYLLRMCTNVVDFRVMRRLCSREWNRQRNWQSVNQHSWDPWQWTTWSRRVTSDFNSVYTPANCDGDCPYFDHKVGGERFYHVSLNCKNLSVVNV